MLVVMLFSWKEAFSSAVTGFTVFSYRPCNTRALPQNTTRNKNISEYCTILPRHVDKPLTVTVVEIALSRQNALEVTEQEMSCKNYHSGFMFAPLIAV